MQRSGSWSLYSQSDPRWRASGPSDSVGGFAMPHEVKVELAKLEAKYGTPPADLEWSYMKD